MMSDVLGHNYAGLQWRMQCFCGENYNRYDRKGDDFCDALCIGNSDQICGGYGYNSVYQTFPGW